MKTGKVQVLDVVWSNICRRVSKVPGPVGVVGAPAGGDENYRVVRDCTVARLVILKVGDDHSVVGVGGGPLGEAIDKIIA